MHDRLKQQLLKDLPLYQPLEHPDFANHYGGAVQACTDRWEIISRFIHEKFWNTGGVAVDFGCHTGWFVRQFSRIGWGAVGVEKSPFWFEVAEAMQPFAGEPKPLLYNENVLEFLPRRPAHTFDIALCLSVAMYLFEDPQAGWKFFDDVSQQGLYMFMDFGGMYADRLPFNADTVGPMMLKRTEFTAFKQMGVSSINRPLFLFEK